MTKEEMGLNFKGESVEYHDYQAKCVELLRAELAQAKVDRDRAAEGTEYLRVKMEEMKLQIGEWEKLVRGTADTLYAIGKDLRNSVGETGRDLMVISTNLHRQCQVIKGEEPLPAPGERLTEKRIDRCQKCRKPVDNVIHFCQGA